MAVSKAEGPNGSEKAGLLEPFTLICMSMKIMSWGLIKEQ